MFDSNKTINSLIEASAAEVTLAQEKHAKRLKVLNWMPENTPVPKVVHNFGYCADYTVQFQGPGLIAELLKLYPPVPLVDVNGSSRTQKPISALRNEDRFSVQKRIYPVVLKDSNSRRWWTESPFGLVALEVITAETNEGLPSLDLYESDSQNYSTGSTAFFIPKLAPPQGKALATTAESAWHKNWEIFKIENEFRMSQLSFINIISNDMFRLGVGLTREDLPEPKYFTPGTALAIPQGIEMKDAIEALAAKDANRQDHPWDRVGNFWKVFSQDDVSKILAFSKVQLELLSVVKAEAIQKKADGIKTLDSMEEWIRTFIASKPTFMDIDSSTVQNIAYRMEVDTGFSRKSLHWFKATHQAQLSIRISVEREVFRDILIPLPAGSPYRKLLPQDVPVDYADPLFV